MHVYTIWNKNNECNDIYTMPMKQKNDFVCSMYHYYFGVVLDDELEKLEADEADISPVTLILLVDNEEKDVAVTDKTDRKAEHLWTPSV